MIYIISYTMDVRTQCGGRPLLRQCAFLGIGNRLWIHRRGRATLWDGETMVRGTYMPNAVVSREDNSGGGDAMARRAGRGNEM